MTRSSPLTLRKRLNILFGSWLALFVLVSGTVVWIGFSHLHRDALDQRLLLARTVAESLDGAMANTFLGLRRLRADLGDLSGPLKPRLRSFRTHSMFRNAVYLLDSQGEVLAGDPANVQPIDLGLLEKHETVTSLVEKSDSSGRPILAVSQPFERQGQRYYLVAEMAPLGSAISTMLQDLAPTSDMHLVLVDRSAKVIAAPDQNQLYRTIDGGGALKEHLENREDYAADEVGRQRPDLDSHLESLLTVMAPMHIAPWGVVVQQHRRSALATIYTMQRGLVVSGLLLLVFGFLLSRALSKSVVSPVQILSEHAVGLREGDLETAIEVTGDHEIELLASTLDEARRRIRSHLSELQYLNENLEQQVADRTAAVETQLEDLRSMHAERRVLIRRLLSASEEERRRIARELHDETSQLLTVIQLSLEESADHPEIVRARELLTRTQKEIHRLIHDLRPTLLDDLGLSAALQWYADNYLKRQGLTVSIEIEPNLDLPPEVEIVAFRVCQEIVTNILRHSQADAVSIELYAGPENLVLVIEDDGIGFDTTERARGAGIMGMKERASLVDGRLEIDSEERLGTLVRLKIPLGESP